MPIAQPPAPYSLRQIQQMLGLSRKVITGLIAAGFVVPQRGPRNAYRFSFQDVVLLRTAHRLRQAQMPPRRLLRSLRLLKARLPAEIPLSGLRIEVIGNDVAVRDAGAPWEAPSGQLVMDFEVAPPGAMMRTVADIGLGPPVGADSSAIPLRASNSIADESAPTGTPTASSLHDLALQYESAGDMAGAEVAYRRALAIEPGHLDAAINLGALLCEAARWRDALKVCDGAIAALATAADGTALLHFNRAIALEELQRPAEALQAYARCLQLDPNLADAHYNAARLHEQMGHAQQALRHLSAFRRLEKKR